MRLAASTRIMAAPAPVFLIGISHSKPAAPHAALAYLDWGMSFVMCGTAVPSLA
jgi:hypothetical protein